MQITGTVYSVGETQQVSEKFKKRTFIIEVADNPTYPQFIQLECKQDKTSLLDEVIKGYEITAHINLEGRLWTNKEGVEVSFNTISCWKLDVNRSVPDEKPQPVNIEAEDDQSDLPF